MIDPFPLRWPDGWARTPAPERRKPHFDTRLGVARDGLLREIRLMGGINEVITSDLPVRRDGLPYANGRAGGDPGIAVYWSQVTDRGGFDERVMACDRWDSPGGNMRAIALSIGALRGMDRWGSSTIVERAFRGFAALPSVAAIDWRQELGLEPNGGGSIEVAREFYRSRARQLHPDRGGDPDAMVRLNQAWEAAQRELGS